MKRTPLRRRSHLDRSMLNPIVKGRVLKPKGQADPVTPELHQAVLNRDGRCFVAEVEGDHLCRDRWGNPHLATDLGRLTVDHVHSGGGLLGKRAPSDLQHLVAMCADANIRGPSSVVRQAEREYLQRLYGGG